MVPKPKIQFRLIEEGSTCQATLSGISCGWQLSLADMGGERNIKVRWHALLSQIELDGEFELLLNYAACENLVARMQQFLDENRPAKGEDYK